MISKRLLSALIFATLVLVAALQIPPPSGPTEPAHAASKNCRSCHRGFRPLSARVAPPTSLGVDLTDTLQMKVGVPWKHSARNVQMKVELPQGARAKLAPTQPENYTVDQILKYSSVTKGWELKGLAPGNVTVGLTIVTTSYYKHKKSSNHNSLTESFSGQVTLSVVSVRLGVNPSTLVADPTRTSSYRLQITSKVAEGRLTGFSLTGLGPMAHYMMVTDLPTVLSPGESGTVNLTLAKGHPAGDLSLNFRLPDGTLDNTTIQVLALEGESEAAALAYSYFLETGALYGWLLVAGMVAAMAQGFTKHNIDQRYLRALTVARKASKRKKRRKAQQTQPFGQWQRHWWWLHASLLTIMLVFIYLHIILTFEADFPIIYSPSMIAGIVAIFFMLAVGFEGFYRRWVKARLSARGWKRLHTLLAALALGLGLAHSLLLRYVFFT